jgi:thioredoxin reductase
MQATPGTIINMNTATNDHDPFMKIQFVVVGGSVAAYASALALSRVGHRVVVLVVEDKYEVVS